MRHSFLFNNFFRYFSQKIDLFSPLTWESYYKDKGSYSQELEKEILLKCTKKGLEDHFMGHIASATDLSLEGDYSGMNLLIENFTYDLGIASYLGIKLDKDLLEFERTKKLILDGFDKYNSGVLTSHKSIFELKPEDYITKVKPLFDLPSMNNLRVRGYILGNDFQYVKETNQLFTFPNSKYQGTDENNTGISIPVYLSPLFVTLGMYYFSKGKNAVFEFKEEHIEEFRLYYLKKRREYWNKLLLGNTIKESNLRRVALNQNNFAKYC